MSQSSARYCRRRCLRRQLLVLEARSLCSARFRRSRVVRARWSHRLLEETAASLARNLRGDSLEDLGRWMKQEADLVRGGLVEGYQRWVDAVDLTDRGDVHVVAAAIESGATIIVTANLKDFPPRELARHSIEAQDPDSFVVRCIAANPVVAERIVADHPDPSRLLEVVQRELPRATRRFRALLS